MLLVTPTLFCTIIPHVDKLLQIVNCGFDFRCYSRRRKKNRDIEKEGGTIEDIPIELEKEILQHAQINDLLTATIIPFVWKRWKEATVNSRISKVALGLWLFLNGPRSVGYDSSVYASHRGHGELAEWLSELEEREKGKRRRKVKTSF